MLFTYIIRNLIGRKGTVLPTTLVLALTVGAITVMLAMLEGLNGALKTSSHADNAVVLRQGADSESASMIPLPILEKIMVTPGIKRVDGAEQVSAEYLLPFKFRQPDGKLKTVNVRGVDPIALKIHGAQIVNGAMPAHSAEGVLIGKQLLGELEGFNEGGTVRIGRHKWPVTGVMSAPGTVFDSEVWCNRDALLGEVRRKVLSAVYVQLDNPEAQAAFAASIGKIPEFQLAAWSEPKFFGHAAEGIEPYLRAMIAVIILLVLSAVFACTNAMYAAFLGRLQELATLMAIGFTRRRIAMLLLEESLLFTLVSGGIGLLLAMTVNGRSLSYKSMSLIYSANVSGRVLLAGLIVSVTIGILGGIASMIQTQRINILQTLRAL